MIQHSCSTLPCLESSSSPLSLILPSHKWCFFIHKKMAFSFFRYFRKISLGSLCQLRLTWRLDVEKMKNAKNCLFFSYGWRKNVKNVIVRRKVFVSFIIFLPWFTFTFIRLLHSDDYDGCSAYWVHVTRCNLELFKTKQHTSCVVLASH